jgi:hypothetical protein
VEEKVEEEDIVVVASIGKRRDFLVPFSSQGGP